jgi:hypothetical protein
MDAFLLVEEYLLEEKQDLMPTLEQAVSRLILLS